MQSKVIESVLLRERCCLFQALCPLRPPSHRHRRRRRISLGVWTRRPIPPPQIFPKPGPEAAGAGNPINMALHPTFLP